MNLKGLTKIKGMSYDEVVSALNEFKIPFDVDEPPKRKDGFFQSSKLLISEEMFDDVTKALGKPKSTAGSNAYYAHYKIDKKNFDFSQLDGKISFSKGSILERTMIETVPYKI